MVNWFVIVATFSISYHGVMEGKITIEPQIYSTESACMGRIAEITLARAKEQAKGQFVPAQILACRGIALPGVKP